MLPAPNPLVPFSNGAASAQGKWRPFGRLVAGKRAVYETDVVPPGGSAPAGIAWMDTTLLHATLYSGSGSPGGYGWRYTAPIKPAQARTLVAAFNGGFYLSTSGGGYYSEHRLAAPLRAGAASLVIYANGNVDIGAWGAEVRMSPSVVAVRQNLILLVDGGRPTPAASSPNWLTWGATCGAYSCSGAGIENQWRSGVGITANGALVYVAGPSLSPLQLAQLLTRARAVRAMELDINPYWTVFATYRPSPPNAFASGANGTDLLSTMEGQPDRFFDPNWFRDFVTMSARFAG
ncbi:MAG: phosphodiester glycosidase family protein [Acidimicrobiales bacterium]